VEYLAIAWARCFCLQRIWITSAASLPVRATSRCPLVGRVFAGGAFAGKPLPSITVVRPVRGLDVDAAKNLAAALDNDYPGEVETIFVFDDDLDPAFATVRQAIADHVAAGGRGTAMLMWQERRPRP